MSKHSKQKKSLKHFVRNVLIVRLIIVAVLLSVLVGTVAYFTNSQNIEDRVIAIAQDRFETLRARVTEFERHDDTNLQQAINKALIALSKIEYNNSAGKFVYYKILSIKNVVLTKYIDESHRHIATVHEYIKQLSFSIQTKQVSLLAERHEFVWLEDKPYVSLMTPIFNPAGNKSGYLMALFALSESFAAEFKNRLLMSIFYVILIIIITTILLYPVVITLTKKLAVSSVELLESNMETLQVLGSAIAQRDSDTNAHNYRVTIISVRLAEQINLPVTQIAPLIKGAFLHDVGKIGISDNILLKPGKLTEQEFTIMKTHVDRGLVILRRSSWLADATDVVGSHHEKFDGNGYPKGLVGDNIPITARIFAIADVFDALASERPYKKAFTFEKTMEILEQSRGTHFDPTLIDNFTIIAQQLHHELNNLDDESLRIKLQDITHKYYSSGLESLVY